MLLSLLAACANENDLALAEQLEYFPQGGNNQVDIVWVVDNSVSMAEEQSLVAAGFESFLAAMAQEGGALDLHMGVVTTDIDEANPTRGQLLGTPAWLTGAEPDFADQLRARVRVGTDGSDMEQGLGAAALTLAYAQKDGVNEGFLRKDATLAVVVVSDENDCTNDGVFPEDGDATLCYDRAADLTPIPELVRELNAAPVGDGRVIVSAIAGPQASEGCATATPGFRYMTVAEKLDGLFGDVCDTDYSLLMDELALQILAPARVFPLELPAREDTLEVEVDGVIVAPDEASAWWYDAEYQSVRFDGDWYPPAGSEVWIRYLVSQ